LILPDQQAEAYAPTQHARPALAFSGGADSTAALLLMPENTLPVFMDRPLRKKASLYNKSAAYATMEHARTLGYDVHEITCDIEYTRSPLGFPTDLVPAIPIILMAQHFDVDAVAFGTVMESAYRIGHDVARNYSQSSHYRLWGAFFAAAGLPFYLPVCGVSEVGTSSIVKQSSFFDFTRSCIRGEWPKSCENCWKCFRKNMIDLRLSGLIITDEIMKKGLAIREVQYKLKNWPVSHENVLSWCLKASSGEVIDIVSKRFEGSQRDLDFLSSYYPPSLELIPQKYRQLTTEKLQSFLHEMPQSDWPSITSYSMKEWLESEAAHEARQRYLAFITQEFPES